MTKENFINGATGYGSHRPLLWEALQATKESKWPVVELGCGDESTPYLRQYCLDEMLEFETYDSDLWWAKKHNSVHVPSWDSMYWPRYYSVALLDLAPGEYRRIALQKLTNTDIIIIHDSEIPGWNASDYKVRPLFSKFKYVKDDVPKEKGAPWTSALSNTIDVSKWIL